MPRFRGLLTASFIALQLSFPLSARVDPDSLRAVLEQKLLDKVVSLRSPDPNSSLRFHSDGTPVFKPEHGIVSLDRDILVKKLRIKDGVIEIRGLRVFYSLDSHKNLKATALQPEIKIELEAPTNSALDESSVAPVINKVFLSGKEKDSIACSAAENQVFLQSFGGMMRFSPEELAAMKNAPEARSKAELESFCIPTGARGFKAKGGVQPPKPVRTDDPEYSEYGRKHKIEGTVVYAAQVDENGQVSDALVVKSLELSLDLQGARAIRNWRFQPATFRGEPVPAMINVEMNFRLH